MKAISVPKDKDLSNLDNKGKGKRLRKYYLAFSFPCAFFLRHARNTKTLKKIGDFPQSFIICLDRRTQSQPLYVDRLARLRTNRKDQEAPLQLLRELVLKVILPQKCCPNGILG